MKFLSKKKLFLLAVLLAIIAIVFSVSGIGSQVDLNLGLAKPIANGLIYPNCIMKMQMIAMQPPIAHVAIPQHPYMGANGGNNMHGSAYMSDAYEASGPIGLNPEVSTSYLGQPGLMPSINFDSKGRIVGVSVTNLMVGGVYKLTLMNANTLRTICTYDLPPRQGYSQYSLGGGIYFFIDNKDRVVVGTFDHTIQVIQIPDRIWQQFKLVREYDVSDYVVPMPPPLSDDIVCVLPDWDGQYYWFGTEQGVVGTINIASGEVHSIWLQGENITNTFAVGEGGAYILTDHALYRFGHDGNGNVVQDWRTEYDRGSQVKPFMLGQGSGTSPTLMGDSDGLVAIADNADPRMNVLFIKRTDGTVVSSIPVFTENQSSTEASLIGFEQADANGDGTGVYSVVIENNWGEYSFPDSNVYPGGITRIDAVRQEDGTYSSSTIWESNEASCNLSTLSFGNGLIYVFTKNQPGLLSEFYLSTLDFRTGQTMYRMLTGTGTGNSLFGTPAYLHPDGGIAYGYTFNGLVMIQDKEAP